MRLNGSKWLDFALETRHDFGEIRAEILNII
jgi:hypothetical protein